MEPCVSCSCHLCRCQNRLKFPNFISVIDPGILKNIVLLSRLVSVFNRSNASLSKDSNSTESRGKWKKKMLEELKWKVIFGWRKSLGGPRQANLVLIAYASSEGSGEPAHPRSLARTSAARSYKQWVKRYLQTESQIPGPSEWLGMRG